MNREGTISQELLGSRWSLIISYKEESLSPLWIFNHKQVVIKEQSLEEICWDKRGKGLLAWEVVTANMEISSELTVISLSSMRLKADTATPLRAGLSTQEVFRRRRHRNHRPESKVLDHTPVNPTEWAPFQNRTSQDSTKTIERRRRPLPRARSSPSSLRNQEHLLDQSHKPKASGHALDQSEKPLRLKPFRQRNKRRSNKRWRRLRLLRRMSKWPKENNKKRSRRIPMRN